MRSHRMTAIVVVGTAGLLSLPGCGGTLGPGAPSLRTAIGAPATARPTPLGAREVARVVRQFWWDDRSGASPSPGQVREVSILRGSFTAPGVSEAIASFRSGAFRSAAWQAWLLTWNGAAWQVLRPVVTSCAGQLEAVAVEPDQPTALLVRDSCTRFGHEEGRVRLISVGPATNVERFAVAEGEDPLARTGMLSSQHRVRIADLDGDGVAEIIDTAEAVYRLEEPDDGAEVTFTTTQSTVFKRDGVAYLPAPGGAGASAADWLIAVLE